MFKIVSFYAGNIILKVYCSLKAALLNGFSDHYQWEVQKKYIFSHTWKIITSKSLSATGVSSLKLALSSETIFSF